MKLVFFLVLCVYASYSTAMDSVALQKNRIIYNEESRRMSLGIENLSNNTNYLVKSWVTDENNQATGAFVVTPPLYVAHPGTLKNVELWRLNGTLPSDRETLFYIYEEAIPSVNKKNIDASTISIASGNVIKLIYRPKGIKPFYKELPNEMIFQHNGSDLLIKNKSSYYITISKIILPDNTIFSHIIPPKSTVTINKIFNKKITALKYYISDDQGIEEGPYNKNIM